MKRILFVILSIIITFSFNNNKSIGEELLVVRVAANYPPYEMTVDGKLTGLHIDLVYAIAKRLDLKVKFRSVPWKRAIAMIENGKADAITYVGKTDEREGFIYYDDGNILSTSNYGFITLKSRSNEIQFNGDLRSMNKYKIGVQRGYSYGNDFDQATYLKKHVVNKMNQLITLMKIGRVDLAVLDEPEYLQNRNKWSNFTFLKPVITNRNFYIGFSKAKKHEKLTKKFAKEMKMLKQLKEYQEILTKYKLNQ